MYAATEENFRSLGFQLGVIRMSLLLSHRVLTCIFQKDETQPCRSSKMQPRSNYVAKRKVAINREEENCFCCLLLSHFRGDSEAKLKLKQILNFGFTKV